MPSSRIRQVAQSFREEGYSLREISRITNISKSTLSLVLRDVKITNPEAIERIQKRIRDAKIKSAGTLRRLSLEGKLKKRKNRQKNGTTGK